MMIDSNYTLLKKIEGVRCNECQQFIWSKSRHDLQHCHCGCCSIDGGRDHIQVGFDPDKIPPTIETYDILYNLVDHTATLLPPEEK